MKQQLQDIAQSCMNGAESSSMTFPQIVQTLIAAGFDGYLVDLRQGSVAQGGTCRYPVAERFDVNEVRHAIRDAQQLVAGYTYGGFC